MKLSNLKEKWCIWEKATVEGEKNYDAKQETNAMVSRLLMIHRLLMSYQDTHEILDDDGNTDETNTGEAANKTINANVEGEEITLKFSSILKVYFNKYLNY